MRTLAYENSSIHVDRTEEGVCIFSPPRPFWRAAAPWLLFAGGFVAIDLTLRAWMLRKIMSAAGMTPDDVRGLIGFGMIAGWAIYFAVMIGMPLLVGAAGARASEVLVGEDEVVAWIRSRWRLLRRHKRLPRADLTRAKVAIDAVVLLRGRRVWMQMPVRRRHRREFATAINEALGAKAAGERR